MLIGGVKMHLRDFPKLESPFERETINGVYQCVPRVPQEFMWVWSSDCIAVDKLDGTNVSVFIQDGKIKTILNRMNVVDIWKGGKWFYEGIKNAIEREYIAPEKIKEEQIFGELVGPRINSNPYNLEEHLWIPFSYLKEHYYFKFWSDFVKECQGKSAQEIFDKTSSVFKGMWSIYKRQRRIKSEVNEDTPFEGSMAAEGIVFYNQKTGALCKLRRDMFSWYNGKRHEMDNL